METDRLVVITGSSSGIGEACVRQLAATGWRVIAGVRSEADGERLVDRIPGRVESVILDVTDQGAIAELAQRLSDEPLSALINNADIALSMPLEFLPLSELRGQLEVNVVGQVGVTRTLIPNLRRARGRIVFIGSIAGRSALPMLGAYAASKHAIEAVADTLRLELGTFGIEVTVVEPGTISTPIWSKGAERFRRLIADVPEEIESLYGPRMRTFRAAANAAARRGAPADDVARVVQRVLDARRPPTRCVVGRDAHLRALIERLPTRFRDRVYRRLLCHP